MSDSEFLKLAPDGRLTLPTALRRKAGLSAGDLLRADVTEDGRIELTPVVAVDRSQAYFWTPRWQRGEREAQEDIEAGRTESFEDVEALIADLKEKD